MSKGRRSVKQDQLTCNQCKMLVDEEEEDFLQCDECSLFYHLACTNINKQRYNYLVLHKNEPYVCHQCSNNSGSIKTELSDIKKELKKLDQLSELQDSVNFMSNKFDELFKGVAENKKKLEIVQRENKILKGEVETLKSSVKFLNDQRVRNDCLIRNVVVNDGTSAVDAVLSIANEAGVEMPPQSISDAYFMKNKRTSNNDGKEKKQVIVVKLNSVNAKQKLMSVKPILKQKEKETFITDYLSRETLSLLNYAKTLKNVGYRAVYPVGGKVYTKRSELSKPRLIRSEEEVDTLLYEATINKPKGRRSHQVELNDEDEDEEQNDMYLSPK